MSSNQLIRQKIRQQRRSLPQSLRHQFNQRICRHLVHSVRFRRQQQIALFLPNDGEVDLRASILQLWAYGKQLYLPVIDDNQLLFASFCMETQLVENHFHIPEPDLNEAELLSARHLDIIYMPLVAFDLQGNRLGMGGGFYDRSLAFMRGRECWQQPKLIGVAYDLQCVTGMETHRRDVPLHGIITENGLQAFAHSLSSEPR